MKKICYITTVSGTLRAFVLPIAAYFREQTDWDITFVCNPEEGFAEQMPEGCHLRTVNMKRGISLGAISHIAELYRFFKAEKFDLIQYSTPNASFYASVAGWLAKVPVRLYCQWGLAYVGFSGFKRRVFKAIEKLVCRLSTWVEPDSQGNLAFSHAEGLYPKEKGSVIWNGSACGINLAKFDISKKDEYRKAIREKLRIGDASFVYCFVGRIKRDKGVNELFRAFSAVEESGADVKLIMVGKNEVDAGVDLALFERAKADPNVYFVGLSKTVEQYMAASDCYVLPSYREGFGMTIIEAEAMGVPVIATDIPGPRDAIVNGETGVIVEKADAGALARAMTSFLEDREQCRRLGASGRRLAEEKFDQTVFREHVLQDRKRLMGIAGQ